MPAPSKHLIVSLHDTHPGSWADIADQIRFIESLGIQRCSLLIVPEFHHEHGNSGWNEEHASALRALQSAGCDLVLHGYYHDREGQADTLGNVFWTRLYTNHEAEFLDLPEADAEKRIQDGLALFKKNDWQPNGFIAPAWLMAPYLTHTLQKLGFRYTNRLTEIIPFNVAADGEPVVPQPEKIQSQSLCYSTRAAWRRFASLKWNRHLFSKLRQTSLIRCSLHPHDLHFAAIREQIEELLKTALQEGFEPTTYAAYVAR